jgi:hypothetical protein
MKTCATCQHWTPNTPPPAPCSTGYCYCPKLRLSDVTDKSSVTIPHDGLIAACGDKHHDSILTGHQFGCIQHQSRFPRRAEEIPSPWPATAVAVLLIVAIIVYYASTGQIILLP